MMTIGAGSDGGFDDAAVPAVPSLAVLVTAPSARSADDPPVGVTVGGATPKPCTSWPFELASYDPTIVTAPAMRPSLWTTPPFVRRKAPVPNACTSPPGRIVIVPGVGPAPTATVAASKNVSWPEKALVRIGPPIVSDWPTSQRVRVSDPGPLPVGPMSDTNPKPRLLAVLSVPTSAVVAVATRAPLRMRKTPLPFAPSPT